MIDNIGQLGHKKYIDALQVLKKLGKYDYEEGMVKNKTHSK